MAIASGTKLSAQMYPTVAQKRVLFRRAAMAVLLLQAHGITTFGLPKPISIGNLLFNKTYNLAPGGINWFSCVSQTDDGGYILSGITDDNVWTAWVLKTDDQGNAQWDFPYQQSNTNLFGSEFWSVAQTTDGGYVAVGIPSLVKVDSSGKMEWNMTGYLGYSVAALREGCVVAGALGNLAASNQTLWVARIALETGSSLINETLFLSLVTLLIIVTVVIVIIYWKKKVPIHITKFNNNPHDFVEAVFF